MSPPQPNDGSKLAKGAGRPNTLNLHARALEALLNMLDSPERAGGAGRKARKFTRWPFRYESVEMRLVQSGLPGAIKVACRNLSRGGMGVLHSAYMHTGTPVELMLPHPRRGVVPVRGKIVRCTHRGGMIHELGVSFAEPIDARDFAGADPLCNTFSLERVDPADLSGTVTLISPAQADRLMLKHYVRESSMRATAFDSVPEAQASLGETDVVLMCTTMPGTTPKKDLGAIRDSGYAGPVILLVPDRLPPTRAAMLALSADAFLVRPLQQEVLLLALAEVLLMRSATAKSRGPSQSLTAGPWLAEGLAELADSIQQAMRRASVTETRGFVAKLRSLADSTGLQNVSSLCAAVDECLAGASNLADAEDGLSKLLTTCETTAREMGGRRSSAA